MTNKAPETEKVDLRSEIRKAASEWASVEFKPSNVALDYHFKLRDFSSTGLGVLAKKDSEILKYIKVGDILYMKYHKGKATPDPQHLKVEIRQISTPANGKPENHMIIGLYILEVLEK